jgi:two-component system, NarL family, nitrate/nitrite response regulator NarL
LPKRTSRRSVISVVRRVSQGQPVLDRSERDRLIAVHRRQTQHERVELDRLRDLSPQEREVLRHLMAGHTVGEIAALRVVSVATVRTQVKAILAKLDLSSQLAAVAVAHRAGWEPHSLTFAV